MKKLYPPQYAESNTTDDFAIVVRYCGETVPIFNLKEKVGEVTVQLIHGEINFTCHIKEEFIELIDAQKLHNAFVKEELVRLQINSIIK